MMLATNTTGMRVTKEKAAEHRAALVRAAGKLFRERGIEGVGVADISRAAGLTHGALYAHFGSKDALAAEALAERLARSNAAMAQAARARATLRSQIDDYVSKAHRDNLAEGCGIAASGCEIARGDRALSATLADGLGPQIDGVIDMLGASPIDATDRERAIAILCAEVGAIVVARGVAKARPRLSEEILRACRRVLKEIGGEGAP